MVREVITISLGQCGIQLCYRIWEQYCAEHDILETGHLSNNTPKEKKSGVHTFFEETCSDLYVPRNLCIDLEPNVIDDFRNAPLSNIFNPQFLLSGKEDASNNFARGHYTNGRDLLNTQVKTRVRKLIEHCDNFQGFFINYSVGGGTGSGLGSSLLESLTLDYYKKNRKGFQIYPSMSMSTCVVEPYNALMATHWLVDHIETSILLDNEALYWIGQSKLGIARPSYDHLNRVISKVVSSVTASLRFEGELNCDMCEFETNLVPFPKLHFMCTSLAPVTSVEKAKTMKNDVQAVANECFRKGSLLLRFPDFDAFEDKYMACLVYYRGDVQANEANNASFRLKQEKKVVFVDWCPTGFKIGLNDVPCAGTKQDVIAKFKRNAVMIGNNAGIHKVFGSTVCRKFDIMYGQKAYVHWYVGEGMEEGEFGEARENLEMLMKDYQEVLRDDPGVDADTDSDI